TGDRNGKHDARENGSPPSVRRVHTVLPREKPGRNKKASVASMRMNATRELTPAPLKNARGYVSAIPKNIAPTKVHGRLVSLPINAAVKASITINVSEYVLKLINGVMSTPATAAMADP